MKNKKYAEGSLSLEERDLKQLPKTSSETLLKFRLDGTVLWPKRSIS